MKANGEYDKLYEKWIGKNKRSKVTFDEWSFISQ